MCIKEDVAEQDNSIQQAMELARDRAAWRRFVLASSSSSSQDDGPHRRLVIHPTSKLVVVNFLPAISAF